jgi:CHAT domain-containing protein
MCSSFLRPALLAGLLAVWGCAPPPASIMAGDTVHAAPKSAGQSLVGESCRYEQAPTDSAGAFTADYAVFCGRWEQPSARVLEAGAARGADPAALAQAGPWRASLSLRAACDAPKPANLSYGQAVLLQCRRLVGGWPHVALVATVGGKVFYADGVPASLPAIETTIASAAGVRVTAAEARISASEQLASFFATRKFGSNDLDDFYRLKQLGDAANDSGDYAAAEQAFRGALAVQERVLGADDPARALPLMSIALQLSNQGRFREAETFFARAGALLRRQPDPLAEATLQLYLAEDAGNRDRLADAGTHAAQAARGFGQYVRLTRPAGLGQNETRFGKDFGATLFMTPDEERATVGLAASLWFESTLAYRRDDFAASSLLANRAQTLLHETRLNAPGLEPRALRIAGLSASGRQDYAAGGATLQRAADLFSGHQANDSQAAVTLFLAGRNALLSGNRETALHLFRRGADLVRSRRLKLPARLVELYLSLLTEGTASAPAGEAATAREGLAALQLVEQGETSQVLAKALVRLAFTQNTTRDLLRTMQDSDLAISRLSAERDTEAARPADMVDQHRLAELDKALASARAARNAADSAAQAASPEYNQLVDTGVTAEAVQARLRPGEAILVFDPGRDATYALMLRHGSIRLARIPLGAEKLLAQITALRRSIVPADDAPPGSLPVFDTGAAHALYTALFGPLGADMEGLNRLVVVPGGPLAMLPLDVLVTAPTAPVTDGDYSHVPFLLEKVAVSYTPSLRTFLIQRTHTAPSAASEPYIGFGDFRPATVKQLTASFPPDQCGHDLAGLEHLPLLPGTKLEITYVANSVFHAPAEDVVLGDQFTKARLLGTDLRRFRIVHLATHGLLPTDLACRPDSTIVVSPDPAAARADSAFVGSADVLSLRLDANLVLLSACNTGSGGQNTGDSLSALARSFFFAGARGLLVTHWDLSEQSAPLLVAFTLSSHEGDTSGALQRAKQLLVHTVPARFGAGGKFYTHPYAWAAFVLVGDGVLGASQS